MQQGKNCPLLFVLFYFLDGLGSKAYGALSSHSELGTVSVSFRDKGSWVQNALELSATDEFSFRTSCSVMVLNFLCYLLFIYSLCNYSIHYMACNLTFEKCNESCFITKL